MSPTPRAALALAAVALAALVVPVCTVMGRTTGLAWPPVKVTVSENLRAVPQRKPFGSLKVNGFALFAVPLAAMSG